MDRSPLNVLEWFILWKFMYLFHNTFGNVDPYTVNCTVFLEEFDRVFDFLKNSYYYKMIRSNVDVVAIIDSDTERCDDKRLLRNEGTDGMRSKWKYYTFFTESNV